MKKYNVIYADCPWSYDNKTTGRTNGDQPEGSGAATKYDTMTNADIMALPVNMIVPVHHIGQILKPFGV